MLPQLTMDLCGSAQSESETESVKVRSRTVGTSFVMTSTLRSIMLVVVCITYANHLFSIKKFINYHLSYHSCKNKKNKNIYCDLNFLEFISQIANIHQKVWHQTFFYYYSLTSNLFGDIYFKKCVKDIFHSH